MQLPITWGRKVLIGGLVSEAELFSVFMQMRGYRITCQIETKWMICEWESLRWVTGEEPHGSWLDLSRFGAAEGKAWQMLILHLNTALFSH